MEMNRRNRLSTWFVKVRAEHLLYILPSNVKFVARAAFTLSHSNNSALLHRQQCFVELSDKYDIRDCIYCSELLTVGRDFLFWSWLLEWSTQIDFQLTTTFRHYTRNSKYSNMFGVLWSVGAMEAAHNRVMCVLWELLVCLSLIPVHLSSEYAHSFEGTHFLCKWHASGV